MLNYRYGINNKQLITGFNENIALNEHLLLSLIVCGECWGGCMPGNGPLLWAEAF